MISWVHGSLGMCYDHLRRKHIGVERKKTVFNSELNSNCSDFIMLFFNPQRRSKLKRRDNPTPRWQFLNTSTAISFSWSLLMKHSIITHTSKLAAWKSNSYWDVLTFEGSYYYGTTGANVGSENSASALMYHWASATKPHPPGYQNHIKTQDSQIWRELLHLNITSD